MALTDVNFQEGEGQDFITEIPTGTSNAALDILVEESGGQFLVMETDSVAGASNIFILSD